MPPFPSPTSTYHSKIYPAILPTRPELSARGKTIIITGGGTGIGAETAYRFAQAGASRVALVGRRPQPLKDTKARIQAEFPEVTVLVAPVDITDKAQVDAAFAQFADGAAGGAPLDVLISNAAIEGPRKPATEVDVAQFLEAVQTNLGGAINVAQAFLRHASATPVVVDVSSGMAHLNTDGGNAAYGVSKTAIVRLWDSLAHVCPNVSLFHIHPGIIETEMSQRAGGVAHLNWLDETSLPGGFMVWLASPEAQFLKGRFLWANWDVDQLKAQAQDIQSNNKLKLDISGWPFPGSAQL